MGFQTASADVFHGFRHLVIWLWKCLGDILKQTCTIPGIVLCDLSKFYFKNINHLCIKLIFYMLPSRSLSGFKCLRECRSASIFQ